MIYLDTCAFVKLVWAEEETASLELFLAERAGAPLVSSALLTVEVRRAVLREAPECGARVDALLSRVGKVGMSPAIVESASRLQDRYLRSLDALHLATALFLGPELDVFVTYDRRLIDSAERHGCTVCQPGAGSAG